MPQFRCDFGTGNRSKAVLVDRFRGMELLRADCCRPLHRDYFSQNEVAGAVVKAPRGLSRITHSDAGEESAGTPPDIQRTPPHRDWNTGGADSQTAEKQIAKVRCHAHSEGWRVRSELTS